MLLSRWNLCALIGASVIMLNARLSSADGLGCGDLLQCVSSITKCPNPYTVQHSDHPPCPSRWRAPLLPAFAR